MSYQFSKIKGVFLPLFGYEFDHGPSGKNEYNSNFVGRSKIIHRIQLLLGKNSKSDHGAYLITGHRGMGKTSVVRQAFNKIVKNDTQKKVTYAEYHNYQVFNFSLSQDLVSDMDLLRQISTEIIAYTKKYITTKDQYIYQLIIALGRFTIIICSIATTLFIASDIPEYKIHYYLPLTLFSVTALYLCLLKVKDLFKLIIAQSCLPIKIITSTSVLTIATFTLIILTLNIYQHELMSFFTFLRVGISGSLKGQPIGFAIALFSLFALIYTSISYIFVISIKYFFDRDQYKRELNTQIELFEKRLFANVVQEDRDQLRVNLGQFNPITQLANRVIRPIAQEGRGVKNILNYEVADSKEIEYYLYNLLKTISKYRKVKKNKRLKIFYSTIPRFVFVIDELDKIEPESLNTALNGNENELHYKDNLLHSITKARQRQKAIAKLLSNLKNFLNDAHAKFIFIGGRDMYDASLADIADRESFYSSIFNEVIYVSSFFKEKLTSNAGLIQVTESFLFQYLNPKSKGHDDRRQLSDYIDLLSQEYFEPNREADKNFKFKIIHLLLNYTIYLTYRSNGSPKKLIEVFERSIGPCPDMKKKTAHLTHQVVKLSGPKERQTKLYLKLSFRDQYTINLTSNFYRPYTVVNRRHLKSLGDNLLYSTAFLIDHVLKYHKSAFSWNNLEIVPDIILSNKDPNFRQFFQDIMNFLSNQYIRETLNAVFQFKFYSKIQNELRYLSKISEYSSAAFNFALDESFNLKKYYKRRLLIKQSEYSTVRAMDTDYNFAHSISYIQSVLGNLHYYDEEYDEAIIYYADAVQDIRAQLNSKDGRILRHQFVIYSSNLLSLGICLEKMRNYDKAYSIYRDLILQTKKFKVSDSVTSEIRNQQHPSQWEEPYKRMLMFMRPHVALLGVIEKQRLDGITYDNLERNINEYSDFLKIAHLQLFPSKENNVLHYDHVKGALSPIFIRNYYYQTEHKNQVDRKRMVTLIVDYYLSVGSILFFKNQLIYKLLFNEKESIPSKKIALWRFDIEAVTHSIRQTVALGNVDLKNYRPSHSAYLYYLHSLFAFNAPFFENYYSNKRDIKLGLRSYWLEIDDIEIGNNPDSPRYGIRPTLANHLLFTLFFFDHDTYPILNNKQYEALANILGKMADALLTCLTKESVQFEEIEWALESEVPLTDYERLIRKLDRKKEHLSFQLVLVLLRLSQFSFTRAGNIFSASFQLKKILYVLKDSDMSIEGQSKAKCVENLGSTILQNLNLISNGSNREQITKYRYYTKSEEWYTRNIYNSLSTAPQIKEVVYLVETVLMKMNKRYLPEYEIGEHNTISSMFSRSLELKLKIDILLRQLKEHKHPLSIDEFILNSISLVNIGGKIDKYELLSALVSDGIFCSRELIKVLNTYGLGYISSFSFLASAHRSMGIFALYYHMLDHASKVNNYNGITIADYLEELVGPSAILDIDPYTNFELARINFLRAKELHTEGRTYQEICKEMYTLDDDFNDNLMHFCAALERYNINTGNIDYIAEEVNSCLKTTKLMQYKNYAPRN